MVVYRKASNNAAFERMSQMPVANAKGTCGSSLKQPAVHSGTRIQANWS